jgi:molybdenum cofactor synthesis domain-containing protein
MKWKYNKLEEAVRAIDINTHLLGRIETCDIDSAVGRVIARNMNANMSIPPWDRSAVDGYAVRSVELKESGKVTLTLQGSVHAGEFTDTKVRKGYCMAIATGAPVPDGADAVVMMEYARARNGRVTVAGRVMKWDNISRKGVDIVQGRNIAAKGTRLTAGVIGALSSQGIREVPVMAKPEVAIIPGGDEIAAHGSMAAPGQIYDVNSHVVAAVVTGAGGEPFIHNPVRDTAADFRKALEWGLGKDICVFVSGSSVGERDLTATTIASRGKLLFHGVRMRPGRPTMFGVVDGKPVFGLPGYPVSSFIGAHLFLRRCIMRMAGERIVEEPAVKRMYRGMERASTEFMSVIPVRLTGKSAYPVFKESGAITSISEASGLVMLRAGKSIRNGQIVDVRLL